MVINLDNYLKPPLGYIIYWIIADLWSITGSPVDGDIATTSTTPKNKYVYYHMCYLTSYIIYDRIYDIISQLIVYDISYGIVDVIL